VNFGAEISYNNGMLKFIFPLHILNNLYKWWKEWDMFLGKV
jgi:hypothetical protein